jgi:Ni/Fe-hydrogenase subunit HybB-like protein
MFDREKLYSDAIAHQQKGISSRWRIIFGILAVIGTVIFILNVMGDTPQRAWQVFLVNLLYFTGIAQGMVILASVIQITSARWGRPLKRFAELGAYFLPLSTIFLIILYFGRTELFSWIEHPIPEKQAWLNINLLFTRDFIGLVLLAVLSFLFLKTSAQLDSAAPAQDASMLEKISARLNLLAPVITLLYALIYTVVAFDLIMSLDPHWYSTLFGAYFFITCFLTGMAALVVILVVSRSHLGLQDYIGSKQFHDLGKLMFAFLVLSGDFFWSQFLVIWYGNLPEETAFVVLRIKTAPWSTLSYIVLFGAFAGPFVLLLSRALKKKPYGIMAVAIVILTCLWVERFLLIVPSIWHEHSLPIGISEILISLGFLGIFGLVYLFAIQKYPIFPVGDPFLQEHLEGYPRH